MSTDELLYAPEDTNTFSKNDPWVVLVVDDDLEVHSITKLALHDFLYDHKKLLFLSAYSSIEASAILETRNDIAIVLLDVVIETDTAGLDLVKVIRERFNNNQIRIIIRTGQPGMAPARYVIDHYDINDYKEKTELTTDRLYITIRSALAQYKHILELENKKNEIYTALITDSVTGLGNRAKLNFDLDTTEPMSLILLNIDSFSMINDVYGFEVGDEMLIQFADILRETSQMRWGIYRLEADIFAILTFFHTNEDIKMRVKEIQNLLSMKNYLIQEIEHRVNVTIGIVEHDHGNMIQKAEIALREARKHSRNRVQYYSENLGVIQQIQENTKWTKWIKTALDTNNILAYFQPIVDCNTKEVIKYESLVRLARDGAVYSPFHFLGTARYAGLLYQITQRVFTQACAKFANNSIAFSINITDQDLIETTFIEFIEEVRKSYNIDSSRIYFEILEESSILNNPIAEEHLHRLTQLGYNLCLDDFGVQCSNFAQIGTLSLSIIKIDGIYIKDINTNPHSRNVTESILFFTQRIGIKTVAEFVHSEKVFEAVKSLGVDYAQGYFFGEPKPELI